MSERRESEQWDRVSLLRGMEGLDGAEATPRAGGSTGGFRPDPRFVEAEAPRTFAGAAFGGAAPAAPEAIPAEQIPLPAEEPVDPIELARAEGYERGLADAQAHYEASLNEAATARERFALAFTRLDADLAERLRQRLLDTVVALCESALRPLAVDQVALEHRVRRAVAMFTRADDERVIRLNPHDLELVRPHLPEDWVFRADPALQPGELRVETQGGGVEDGPAQWRRAILEALDLGATETEGETGASSSTRRGAD